jgi:hypothetical protein
MEHFPLLRLFSRYQLRDQLKAGDHSMGIKQLPLPPEAGRILKQGGFFDAESIIHLLRSPREDVTAGMLYLTLRSWQSVYPMCITEMFLIATGPQIQTRMNLHGLNRNSVPEINTRVSPLLCALFDRRISHCCLACVCPW